jgi:hypothetical protein
MARSFANRGGKGARMKKRLLGAIATLLMGAGISSGQSVPPMRSTATPPVQPVGGYLDALPVLPGEAAPALVPAGSRTKAAADSAPPLFPAEGMPLFSCPEQFPLDLSDDNVAPVPGSQKIHCFGCAWVSAEALAWWVKNPPLPTPLVTTAPTGRANFGAPGTTVLYGGDDVNTKGPLYGTHGCRLLRSEL